jgi:hypothetical protein
MVPDAKLLANDCRDALGGPDFPEEAEAFGTPGEQMGDLCKLVGG